MSNPHGTPIWYELQSHDPDAAARFYEAVVGWAIEGRPPGEVDYRMISAGAGHVGGLAGLREGAVPPTMTPGWKVYIGVDDVDAAARALVDGGGTVMTAPFDLPGVGRMAFVADPQGTPFNLMRGATEGAESTSFSPTLPGRGSWNELSTSDQPAALAFYTGLFGWRVAGAMPMGATGDYTFLALGETPLGAAMTGQPGSTPAWRFYFRVPDADAAAAAITANGGTVEHGPTDVPGGARVVVARDPQGAAFGVVSGGVAA